MPRKTLVKTQVICRAQETALRVVPMVSSSEEGSFRQEDVPDRSKSKNG